MSTMQRVTLIGLYNYENQFETDLFNKLVLPSGFTKTTFVNTLLLEHGEKCVLYNDPDFFMNAIGVWSDKWNLELTRLYEAMTAEYNPIYNYDRFESSKDIDDHTLTNKPDWSNTQTNDYDVKTTNDFDVVNEQNVDATLTHDVSADNSSGYQPDYKDTTSAGKITTSNDGTITTENDGTIKNELSGTTDNIDEDRTQTHVAHLYGNIGVTTSAQMVTEILHQRTEYNLYSIAAKLFANELLLGIY